MRLNCRIFYFIFTEVKLQLNYFILFLLVVALLPYFVICFYALPFADDFCFGWTASENISFLQKFLNQYLYWNGRYTADALVNLNPLVTEKIINYQLAVFISLAATPVVIYFFIKEVGIAFQCSMVNSQWLMISMLITLVYLNYQPNITEGIYWFIGISNYHLCNLLFLVQITLLLKSFSVEGLSKILLQALSLLLLIVSIGFNEIGAMLIPALYLCLAVVNRQSSMVNRQVLVVFTLVAFFASGFVFFSPGNFVRTQEFENRYDLLHSLLYSLAQTARFIAEWILNVPFVLLSLLVLANTDKVRSKTTIDYKLLVVAMLFVVFVGSFLPYFATGVLGQHRTINFVFFFFILLWVLVLLSVSEKSLLYKNLERVKNEMVIVGLLLVSILLMAITGNGIKIIADFKQGNFKKYEIAFVEREKEILKNPAEPIKKLSVIPNTFQIVDVREDSTWWVDKCMKKYYFPLP